MFERDHLSSAGDVILILRLEKPKYLLGEAIDFGLVSNQRIYHFWNDATALPWIVFFMMTKRQ